MGSSVPTLLFVSHRFPYPPDRGERIRGINLLRHLATRYRVLLGCVADGAGDLDHLDVLREVCAEVAAFPIDKRAQKLRALARIRPGRPLMLDYYGSPALHAWVDATVARERPDILYLYSTAMAPYGLHHEGRRILDMQDVDSEKWAEYARNASYPMKLVWAREARTLLAYERRATMACERTFLVSEPEVRRFLELAPETEGRVVAVENGVDLERFAPGLNLDSPYPEPGPHVVFVGNMDYWPNADAAVWFAREVLPLVRAALPGARFHAVGANPGPDVQALASLPGVQVTGRVPDVRPYVAHAGAVVAPLRIARGIQNKVLEGMAMARPVVATPQAFEGVHAEPGRDLLVADGTAAFAARVVETLRGEHAGVGAAGRRAVEQGHTWAASLRRLDAFLA
jgi:sugar transferase (PEP-CTERM/EpsH1 system associated)